MKTSFKLNAILPLAAMLITTAFAIPSTAHATDLRIAGSLDTAEDHVVTPPTMTVELEGTGHASGLGRFVLETHAVVFLPTFYGTGVFSIDTGGGMLSGTLAGYGHPTPDVDAVPVEETFTITGGTGRFLGATGTINSKRILSRSTGVSSGTIEGTITLPDRGRSGN